MNYPILEIKKLSVEMEDSLLMFFRALQNAGDDKYFHPHAFNRQELEKILTHRVDDLYFVMLEDERVIGYAMLRGWDEGYSIPSLGISIHPEMRDKGLGKTFMQFLHSAARLRNSSKIRLKVYPENVKALKLYRKLGYKFQDKEGGQLVGFLELSIE